MGLVHRHNTNLGKYQPYLGFHTENQRIGGNAPSIDAKIKTIQEYNTALTMVRKDLTNIPSNSFLYQPLDADNNNFTTKKILLSYYVTNHLQFAKDVTTSNVPTEFTIAERKQQISTLQEIHTVLTDSASHAQKLDNIIPMIQKIKQQEVAPYLEKTRDKGRKQYQKAKNNQKSGMKAKSRRKALSFNLRPMKQKLATFFSISKKSSNIDTQNTLKKVSATLDLSAQ